MNTLRKSLSSAVISRLDSQSTTSFSRHISFITTPQHLVFDINKRSFSSSFDGKDDGHDSQKIALVIGSSGCLGGTVAQYLSQEMRMRVIGTDINEGPDINKKYLNEFISISPSLSLGESTAEIYGGVSKILGDFDRIDTIICASGGWAGDPPLPKPFATMDEILDGAHAYGETVQHMINVNLNPVVTAGFVAQRLMAPNGLFVVIGATAALSPSPGMLGYGISKAATHHLIHTFGSITGKSVVNKASRKQGKKLREEFDHLDTLTVVGILPTTIDTPANRKAMPKANFNEWTKPIDIATEIGSWITTPPFRPHSGSLVKVQPSRNGGGNDKDVSGGGGGATFQLVR